MKDWREMMVEHLTLKGCKKNTIETYTAKMRAFLKYLGDGVDVNGITEEQYREYVIQLINGKNYKTASIKSVLHGTRSFFKDILGKDWYAF